MGSHATLVEMMTSFTRVVEFLRDPVDEDCIKAGKIAAEIYKGSGQLDLVPLYPDPMEHATPEVHTIKGLVAPFPMVGITKNMHGMVRAALAGLDYRDQTKPAALEG